MMGQPQEESKGMARNNTCTISTINMAGYRVNGKVCGISVSFLLDTGVSITLLRKDIWERVSAVSRNSLSPWSGQCLVGVNGSSLQVFGHSELQFMLSGREFMAQVLVVSPLTTEAILGLDFLQHHVATIDLGRKELLIGQESSLHMPLCRLPLGRPGVCLVEPVHIPRCSELLVMGSTEESGEGTSILESSASRTGVLVTHALVSPEQGRVPVVC